MATLSKMLWSNEAEQFKVNVHHWLVFEVGYPFNMNFPPALIRPWLDID